MLRVTGEFRRRENVSMMPVLRKGDDAGEGCPGPRPVFWSRPG